MAVSEEATEEIEALESIFDDRFQRIDDSTVRVEIAPEPDTDGHVYGTASLFVTFTCDYPLKALPSFRIESSAPVPENVNSLLQELVESVAAAEGVGQVVVYTVADAVREWLQEHTRTEAPPPPPATTSHTIGTGENDESDDDELSVDSEDLDDEMIEALQEVLAKDTQKLKELKKIKKMEGSEQRSALRGMLKSLTPKQREELVGSSSDSSDEDEPPPPSNKREGGAGTTRAAPVQLPPALIECSVGHELTAFSSRPPDYRNFDGDMYTCDICARDGRYKNGVYHCTKCFAKGGKQFDACPTCGSQPAKRGGSGGGGGGGGKKQKGGNKKR